MTCRQGHRLEGERYRTGLRGCSLGLPDTDEELGSVSVSYSVLRTVEGLPTFIKYEAEVLHVLDLSVVRAFSTQLVDFGTEFRPDIRSFG